MGELNSDKRTLLMGILSVVSMPVVAAIMFVASLLLIALAAVFMAFLAVTEIGIIIAYPLRLTLSELGYSIKRTRDKKNKQI
jgi:hypothetical protein